MPPRSDALAIGTRLELRAASGPWLPTRVEDHTADGRLVVAWPTDHDRGLIKLTCGQSVELASSASGDALYEVTATVLDIVLAAVPLVTLQADDVWRRSQRRTAYRADVAIKPRLAARVNDRTRKPLRLGVTNVSAGGLQLRSRDELHHGDLLELAFDLDGQVEVQARVNRVHRLERVWEAGCEFENIPSKLVERIVQFIFAEQRQMLRTRRGER